MAEPTLSSAPLKTTDLPLAARTAPERIWLDLGVEEAEHANFAELGEVTWSPNNATGHGIAYVRTDTQAVAAQAPANGDGFMEAVNELDGLYPATEDSSAGDSVEVQAEPVAWPHKEIGMVAIEWGRQKRLFPVLSKDGWMDKAIAELSAAYKAAAPQAQPADAITEVAIEELSQLGYTVKDGRLIPPDHVGELMTVVQASACGCQYGTCETKANRACRMKAEVATTAGPDATKPADADEWYLQDTRSHVGNDVLWWAKDGKGYTTDLRNAHVFKREAAIQQAEARGCDRPWPKAYIDGKARPAVDMQYIDHAAAMAGKGA